MKEKNTWTKRIVDKINPHVDEKFEEYRLQVSSDLARGISESAGILVLLASGTLILAFAGLALGLLIGLWFDRLALGFLVVTIIYIGIFFYLFYKGRKIIQSKVLEEMSESLRIPIKQTEANENQP